MIKIIPERKETESSSVMIAGNPNLAQQEPEQQQYAILIHHPEALIWNDSFALKAVGFFYRVILKFANLLKK